MELFCITIAWIFGIIWGLYFKISIAFFVVPVIFIGILSRKKKIKKYFIWFLISLVISNLQITLLEKSFSEKYKNIGENLEIVGTVISNPIDKEYKNQYTLKVEKIDENKKYQNTNLQLNVKKEKENLSYGDKIIVKGNFEEASTARNEGGFNYKQYLKTKKIYGIVTVDKKDVKVVNKNNTNIIELLANKVRNSMKGKIEQNLTDATSGLLSGMLIGDKSNLPKEIQEDFRNSSLSHILAISGMHVSYVMLGITVLISKMKFSKKISKMITIVILLFFIILTGKTASVERACFMSVYAILASLLHKRANVLASISISILIILIINPYSILDIGLQLSYGGTLGIVLIYSILKKCKKSKKEKAKENKFQKLIQKIKEKILDIIRITVSANLVIFPIILYQYNTMSFTFIISNLLISSIIGIIIILGFISVFTSYVFMPLAKIMFFLTQILLNILAQTAHLCAKIPFSKVYFPTPKIYVIIIYYLFLIYIILAKRNIISVKKISKKIFIIFIIIVIILNLIVKVIPKEFTISFIDVGQGDSMLISTPRGKRILVDGGGTRDSENFDVGRQTLIPYLLNKGITKLDYIVISHFDSDHATGVAQILGKIDVSSIILTRQLEENDIYRHILSIAKEKKIKLIYVKEGDVLKIGGIKISIIHPENKLMINNPMNNNSIVCKVEYNSFSMLLTGDIEMEAEELILRKNINLKADVLKVAHHGSKTSTTGEFLKAINPKVALIGVGKNNNFGHPSNEVIQRLKENGTRIYRTDENGEISITVNKKGRIIKIQRCIT